MWATCKQISPQRILSLWLQTQLSKSKRVQSTKQQANYVGVLIRGQSHGSIRAQDGTVNSKAANMRSETSTLSHGLKTHITCAFKRKGLRMAVIKQEAKHQRHPGQVLHILYCNWNKDMGQHANTWAWTQEGDAHTLTAWTIITTHKLHFLLLWLLNSEKKIIAELPLISRAGIWSGFGLHPDSVQIGNFKVEKVQSYELWTVQKTSLTSQEECNHTKF